MGGKSKAQTVGYHYRPAFHVGLVGRMIDAFLEYRAADKTAWAGELTASGRIQIDAPDLFGGEKDQGGIVGPVDVMFGEPDQLPNPYLAEVFGNQTVAWRGMTTLAFCGGRFGAMNPYQQKSAYKIRKILNGWDGETWYPEKAAIVIGRFNAAERNWRWLAVPNSDSVNRAAVGFDDSSWSIGRPPFADKPWPGSDPGTPGGYGFATVPTTVVPQAMKVWMRARLHFPELPSTIRFQAFVDNDCRLYVNGQLVTTVGGHLGAYYDIPISTAAFVPGENVIAVEGWDRHSGSGNWFWFDWRLDTGLDALGMNPAHILYYIRTDSEKGAEPRANINDASLAAAADRLSAEAFGLNVVYDPAQDAPDAKIQRICQIIGGSFDRSLIDGQWYLDLARGDYDLESLPIMGDDDILELEVQPTTLHGVTNSVAVRYFDPIRKESVITPAVRALGLIGAFGEIHETLDFPEIGSAAIALRVADRELRARITPSQALPVVTRPRLELLALRRSQYFRLQSPKRGIADMVCIVGEKGTGTLRSGAVRWKVAQDIYSLPLTSYVEVEEGVDTRPDPRARPITEARVFEAPYINVVAALPRAELEALPGDVGFLQAVAASPGSGLDYTLKVAPQGGDYETVAAGEWCPTAIINEAAGFTEREFTFGAGRGLGQVGVGTAVLWGEEIGRVDAIDIAAGTVEIARGCADTVPHKHDPGERVWFLVDGATADDVSEYAEGETVNAKLLHNTGSQQFSLGLAVPIPLAINGRPARPYPPAGLLINGDPDPDPGEPLPGTVELEWVPRDRVLQADQLMDTSAPGVGPEPGATVTVEYRSEDGSELIDSETGILGPASTPWSPPIDGRYRIEVFSQRDSIESLQRHSRVVLIGAETWRPEHLAVEPVVWLDWNSPLTEVSGAAGAWSNSKGTAGGDFTNPTQARRPVVLPNGLAGKRVLSFDDSNDYLINLNSSAFRNVPAAGVFVIYRKRLTDAVYSERPVVLFGVGVTPVTTRVGLFSARGSANAPQFGGRNLDTTGFDFVQHADQVSGSWAIAFGQNNYAARTISLGVNGYAPTVKSSAWVTSASTSDTDGVNNVIGAFMPTSAGGIPPESSDLDLALIIGVDYELSVPDRQRLEGWAAWECELVEVLPADHPFKHVRPYRNTPVLQASFGSGPAVIGLVAEAAGGVIGMAAGPAAPNEFGVLLNSQPQLMSGEAVATTSDGTNITVRLDGVEPATVPAKAVVMDHKGGVIQEIPLIDQTGYFEGTAAGELDEGGTFYVRIEAA